MPPDGRGEILLVRFPTGTGGVRPHRTPRKEGNMHVKLLGSSRRVLVIAGLALFAVAAAPSAARGGTSPSCPSSSATADAYTLKAGALTGPAQTDVSLTFTAAPGCGAVQLVKHVQIKTYADSGRLERVLNLDDVAAENGVAAVALDRVEHGLRIEADVLVQTGTPPRTYVLRDATTSLLRPDLVVSAVDAAAQTLTTRPIDVRAEIAETNGDVGATASVALADALGPLADPIEITIAAHGHVSVTFTGVRLTTASPVELKVLVTDAAPGQYDVTTDERRATVDVTKNELVPSRLLVESLGGYGFQFNHHLYAPITNPPPETLPDLEAKVIALEPQLTRIFYSETWEANADAKHPEWAQNLESFRNVVELANEANATIVVAYQTIAFAKTNPTLWMNRFAAILEDLVRARGLTNVRWVSIANEPNSTALTLAQYEALYRALDAELVARQLDDQIGLIGGDLVESSSVVGSDHRKWFAYMTTHMNDVIDAWSEHVYWNYWDHFRMEERLKDVSHLVHEELDASARKPTFLMEYGVRGYDTCGTMPNLKAAYFKAGGDCLDLRRMSLAGFHKVWFTVASAQLGFDAASSWDLYWSVYDLTKANQSYWTIGPPEEDWALYPSYYASQLLLQTTARGWQVLGVDPWNDDDKAAVSDDAMLHDQLEQELTALAGPNAQLTLVGLDTNGGRLAAPNGESSSYSIGGLPSFTAFTLALWNASGDGKNSVAGTVTTNAAGVARFDVPLQAAFVLTTVPVS